MKFIIFLFAFSVSLLLTSCSQPDQEISPLTPQMFKTAETPDQNTFPYPNLTEFPELKVENWDNTTSDSKILVTLAKHDKESDYIFCEIEYVSLQETTSPNNELIFIGNPAGNTFSFAYQLNKEIVNIRVYAFYATQDLVEFPYSYLQKFNPIPVTDWVKKGETISITASDEINNYQHLFMKINSDKSNMLVFIGKPGSSNFDIPKYGDTNVEELSLYGLNYIRSYEVQ